MDGNILRIFHTSDEHGWFEGRYSKSHDVRTGGFELLSRYLKDHGFDRDLDVLVSSGDSWTGPALSTLLQGEPMVKAMNHLGYRAAAMGNHEFDFGVEAFRRNAKASAYSYLGANMEVPATGDAGRGAHHRRCQRVQARHHRVDRDTPKVTLATNIEGIVFSDYAESALAEAQG